MQYRGKTALITGASSGIGAAFAQALAQRGMDLVLVARSRDQLQAVANEASRTYGVRAEVIVADLSHADAIARVQSEVARLGLSIHMLVNNAGFATHGVFDGLDAAREQEQVAVNIAVVVALTRAFLPPMVNQGDGAIVNVASIAAWQPTPYSAVYGASKAFVLSFSEALAVENRHRGVRVLALCPGRTETGFFAVAGINTSRRGGRSPEQVAETALHALERGQSAVVDGAYNTVLTTAVGLLPRAWAARLAGWRLRPRA